MSCQRMFGKHCYWGACKRKQILSVIPVTGERDQNGTKEGLQKQISSFQKWQPLWANKKMQE